MSANNGRRPSSPRPADGVLRIGSNPGRIAKRQLSKSRPRMQPGQVASLKQELQDREVGTAIKKEEAAANGSNCINLPMRPAARLPQPIIPAAGAAGPVQSEFKSDSEDEKRAPSPGGAPANSSGRVMLLPIDKVACPQKINEEKRTVIHAPFAKGYEKIDMVMRFVTMPSNGQAQPAQHAYRIAQIGIYPHITPGTVRKKPYWYHPVSCSLQGKARKQDYIVFSYTMHRNYDFNKSQSMVQALEAAPERSGKNFVTRQTMKYKQLNVTVTLSYSSPLRCGVRDPDKALIQGVKDPVTETKDGVNYTEIDRHYQMFFRAIEPRQR